MKMRKAPRTGRAPLDQRSHNEHKWSGRGAHINIELFNCNRVYRCLVLRRLLPEVQQDLRWTSTRALLQLLWAQGGEERTAAEHELQIRWYGHVREVVA